MKTILIDDERIALNQLAEVLSKFEHVEIIGMFSNPLGALINIQTLNPDVVFIDINMPNISGLYLAEQITNMFEDIKIVFVSAYDKYAINAFEINALDYLLKPASKDRMDKCISKLLKNKSKTDNNKIINLNNNYNDSLRKIFVNDEEDIVLLPIHDILYFESIGKYTKIQTMNNTYKSTKTLTYYENKLEEQNFFRCQKSYLINLDKIERLISSIGYTYYAILPNCDKKIPISRNRLNLLKQLLQY